MGPSGRTFDSTSPDTRPPGLPDQRHNHPFLPSPVLVFVLTPPSTLSTTPVLGPVTIPLPHCRSPVFTSAPSRLLSDVPVASFPLPPPLHLPLSSLEARTRVTRAELSRTFCWDILLKRKCRLSTSFPPVFVQNRRWRCFRLYTS